MATFPLPAAFQAIHDEALDYASTIQNNIAVPAGSNTLVSEALNILAFNAVLAHRSVRTLCEEGWTPVTSVIIRTLLDIFGNCVAVCIDPQSAEFMAFKYISHFYRKRLAEDGLPADAREEATAAIEILVQRLNALHQERARGLLGENASRNYWFQPEYQSTRAIFDLAQHSIYELFRIYSGPTHGGFDMKLFMNDELDSGDIRPRPHERNAPRAVIASSRILAEVCHIRDDWEHHNANEIVYRRFIQNLIRLQD